MDSGKSELEDIASTENISNCERETKSSSEVGEDEENYVRYPGKRRRGIIDDLEDVGDVTSDEMSLKNEKVDQSLFNDFFDDIADVEESGSEDNCSIENYIEKSNRNVEDLIDDTPYSDNECVNDFEKQLEEEFIQVSNDPLLQRICERYLESEKSQNLSRPVKTRSTLESLANQMHRKISSHRNEQDSDSDEEKQKVVQKVVFMNTTTHNTVLYLFYF